MSPAASPYEGSLESYRDFLHLASPAIRKLVQVTDQLLATEQTAEAIDSTASPAVFNELTHQLV